ncbi:MAG: hypothetical protein Q8K00_06505 [Syntrophales bacterium]|nr:hypothetical protein [Syntrophales bacterium]
MIETQTMFVKLHNSEDTKAGALIVSVASVIDLDNKSRAVDLVVGRVGVPGVERTLKVGGAIYFDTRDEGVFEVRVMSIQVKYYSTDPPTGAVVRVSHLRPGGGTVAGLGSVDIANTPFEPDEVERILGSITSIQEAVTQRSDITPEQQDYINRKLDEVIDAATRVGRKDWINLAIGTLTNVVVNVGLGSVPARFIFQAMGDALSWLVGQTIRLLS